MSALSESTAVDSIEVLVLSHDPMAARSFSEALKAAVAHQSSAGAQVWQITAATGARDFSKADFSLLLPWDEDGTEAQDPDLSALQAHSLLRQSLLERQQSFQALRGSLAQQLQQALAALSVRDRALMPAGAQTLGRPGWRLACEKCDDPACEHILLEEIRSRRQGSEPAL